MRAHIHAHTKTVYDILTGKFRLYEQHRCENICLFRMICDSVFIIEKRHCPVSTEGTCEPRLAQLYAKVKGNQCFGGKCSGHCNFTLHDVQIPDLFVNIFANTMGLRELRRFDVWASCPVKNSLSV